MLFPQARLPHFPVLQGLGHLKVKCGINTPLFVTMIPTVVTDETRGRMDHENKYIVRCHLSVACGSELFECLGRERPRDLQACAKPGNHQCTVPDR